MDYQEVAEEKPRLRSPKYCNAAGVASLVLFVLGTLSATLLHDTIDGKLRDGLREQYILDSPSAGDYAAWSDSEAPDAPAVFTDFYVYHLNNPWAVAYQGAKPNVTEIGPLTYKYMQKKANVTWDADDFGDVVTFNQWQYYVAADDRTRALEKLNVTSVYAPLLGALANPLAKLVIQLMPEYSSPGALWTNRSVYEIIWGWEDPLLALLAPAQPGLPTRYPGLQSNDTSLEQALALHQPSRMRTGVLAPELQRQFVSWNGMDEMQCCPYGPCGDSTSGANSSATAVKLPWHSADAEAIGGAAGDQFHQYMSATDRPRVGTYEFGIYRHWDLSYAGQYDVGGVTLYRFQLAADAFGNDTTAPAEAAQYDGHGPAGLLNLTQCYWGAPVYISKPRFLDGSPSLRDAVDGIGPLDRDKLDTWLGIEPTVGQSLDFHVRIGANIHLAPVPGDLGFTFFPDVTPVYFPLLWADRYATANSDQIGEFKGKVYFAQSLMAWARNGGIALAVVAGVAALALFGVGWLRRRALEAARDGELAYYQQLVAAADGEAAGEGSAAVGYDGGVDAVKPDGSGANGGAGLARIPSHGSFRVPASGASSVTASPVALSAQPTPKPRGPSTLGPGLRDPAA